MSDFVKTMKDWRRMCAARIRLYGYDFCKGCSLENFRCPAIYNIEVDTDYSIVEREVSAWAAEHPEPKYPSWVEWLMKCGVLMPTMDTDIVFSEDGKHLVTGVWFTPKAYEPMPADIAEKLRLKPKGE